MILRTIFSENLPEMEQRQRTALINSLSGYKSANLIGTINQHGRSNLAIYSSVFHLGANPALLGMVSRPIEEKTIRHTLRYIRETGYYTINHVNSAICQEAHQCSARYLDNVSEFEATGLNEEYIGDFPVPFVKESKVKIGMRYVEDNFIKYNDTYFIIGEVVLVQYPEAFQFLDGTLDLVGLETVAVSGLNTYHEGQTLGRLAYAKP